MTPNKTEISPGAQAEQAGAAPKQQPGTKSRSAREELLTAADALMLERNSLDISLSEIAGRAGVNSALVKYHFGSKRGLLVALVERNIGNSMGALSALADRPISPVDKLRIHISGVVNLYYRYRYLNSLQHALLRDSTPEQAQDFADKMFRPAAAAQRKILQEGVALGVFRETDAMMFYLTIFSSCDIFFRQNKTMRTLFNTEIGDDVRARLLAHVTSVLLNGIVIQDRIPDAQSDKLPRRSTSAA